jgi:hypothetical protein
VQTWGVILWNIFFFVPWNWPALHLCYWIGSNIQKQVVSLTTFCFWHCPAMSSGYWFRNSHQAKFSGGACKFYILKRELGGNFYRQKYFYIDLQYLNILDILDMNGIRGGRTRPEKLVRSEPDPIWFFKKVKLTRSEPDPDPTRFLLEGQIDPTCPVRYLRNSSDPNPIRSDFLRKSNWSDPNPTLTRPDFF